ncbi:MAG: heme-binding domain-containing protein [Chloroflexota bacterium]
MKKWLKRLGVGLVIVVIGLQFVPVERTNPAEHGQPQAPAEIQALLRRACYDCHSNETIWPWYSQIAPLSLLLARDVKEGRREVNFSTWEKYEARRKNRKLKEIAEQVEKGDMPPWYYLPFHPDAKLSAAEREMIIKWATRG